MTPYEQGLAHYQAGDYQAGLASFTEAIRLDLKPIDAAYYERSKCYEALGQIDAAKADLAHMLTLSIDETRREHVIKVMTVLTRTQKLTTDPPTKSYDFNPFRQQGGILSSFVNGMVILSYFVFLAVVLQPQIYTIYKETRLLQQTPQYTMAEVTQKSIIRQFKYTSYRIKYKYTVSLQEKTFIGYDDVEETIYNHTDQTIRIVSSTADPSISKVAENFGPISQYIAIVVGETSLILPLLMLIITFIINPLFGSWQAQQIIDNGRIAQARVLDKYKNIVYYNYYYYEASYKTFDKDYDRLKAGDTIKVGYLPAKPHISTPYYY